MFFHFFLGYFLNLQFLLKQSQNRDLYSFIYGTDTDKADGYRHRTDDASRVDYVSRLKS